MIEKAYRAKGISVRQEDVRKCACHESLDSVSITMGTHQVRTRQLVMKIMDTTAKLSWKKSDIGGANLEREAYAIDSLYTW